MPQEARAPAGPSWVRRMGPGEDVDQKRSGSLPGARRAGQREAGQRGGAAGGRHPAGHHHSQPVSLPAALPARSREPGASAKGWAVLCHQLEAFRQGGDLLPLGTSPSFNPIACFVTTRDMAAHLCLLPSRPHPTPSRCLKYSGAKVWAAHDSLLHFAASKCGEIPWDVLLGALQHPPEAPLRTAVTPCRGSRAQRSSCRSFVLPPLQFK